MSVFCTFLEKRFVCTISYEMKLDVKLSRIGEGIERKGGVAKPRRLSQGWIRA